MKRLELYCKGKSKRKDRGYKNYLLPESACFITEVRSLQDLRQEEDR